eukprot:jgi/Bigna1/80110/fgenesh1_pg.67_\
MGIYTNVKTLFAFSKDRTPDSRKPRGIAWRDLCSGMSIDRGLRSTFFQIRGRRAKIVMTRMDGFNPVHNQGEPLQRATRRFSKKSSSINRSSSFDETPRKPSSRGRRRFSTRLFDGPDKENNSNNTKSKLLRSPSADFTYNYRVGGIQSRPAPKRTVRILQEAMDQLDKMKHELDEQRDLFCCQDKEIMGFLKKEMSTGAKSAESQVALGLCEKIHSKTLDLAKKQNNRMKEFVLMERELLESLNREIKKEEREGTKTSSRGSTFLFRPRPPTEMPENLPSRPIRRRSSKQYKAAAASVAATAAATAQSQQQQQKQRKSMKRGVKSTEASSSSSGEKEPPQCDDGRVKVSAPPTSTDTSGSEERKKQQSFLKSQQSKCNTRASYAFGSGIGAATRDSTTSNKQQPLSNVERFFMEEKARRDLMRRDQKRTLLPAAVRRSEFVAPKDRKQAKEHWLKLKQELDLKKKWQQNINNTNNNSNNKNSSKTVDKKKTISKKHKSNNNGLHKQQKTHLATEGGKESRNEKTTSNASAASGASNTTKEDNKRRRAKEEDGIRKKSPTIAATTTSSSSSSSSSSSRVMKEKKLEEPKVTVEDVAEAGDDGEIIFARRHSNHHQRSNNDKKKEKTQAKPSPLRRAKSYAKEHSSFGVFGQKEAAAPPEAPAAPPVSRPFARMFRAKVKSYNNNTSKKNSNGGDAGNDATMTSGDGATASAAASSFTTGQQNRSKSKNAAFGPRARKNSETSSHATQKKKKSINGEGAKRRSRSHAPKPAATKEEEEEEVNKENIIPRHQHQQQQQQQQTNQQNKYSSSPASSGFNGEQRESKGQSQSPKALRAAYSFKPPSFSELSSGRYAGMSIREIRVQLARLGVTNIPPHCTEKSDIVKLLVEEEKKAEERKKAELERIRIEREKLEAKARSEREARRREKKRVLIAKQVERWARRKSLSEILNHVNGYARGDKLFVHRRSTYATVNKAFRKACLKIHPDKNMGDFDKHVKATEQFKVVNQLFADYKERMGWA